MNDTENDPAPDPGAADPVVAAALQTIVPPEHAPDFWDRLEVRLTESAAGPAPAPAPPPVLEAPSRPLAKVVPLSAARRSGPRWMAVAAAVLAVVAVATSLLQTKNTEVETTAPPTRAPEQASSTTPSDEGPTSSAALTPTTLPTSPLPTSPLPTNAVPSTASTATPAPTARPAPTAPPAPPASPATTTDTVGSFALPASPIEAPEFVLSLDGVGPLRLGMTTQEAQATGAIETEAKGTSCPFFRAAGPYRFEDFGAIFLDDRLAQIGVDNELSRIRTPEGIGIGMPSSRLEEIPGTRVDSPSGSGTAVDISTGDLSYQFYVVEGVIRSWSVGTRQG